MSEIKRIIQVIERYPPNGKYRGVWSGYIITFTDSHGDMFECETRNWRGIDVPCEVTIENGAFSARMLTMEERKQEQR